MLIDDSSNFVPPDAEQMRRLTLLLQHLFDKFCTLHAIPQERRVDVPPSLFYRWLDQAMGIMVAVTECAAVGVDVDSWNCLSGLLSRPEGGEILISTWIKTTIGNRPLPEHRLRTMNMICLLTWQDGSRSINQVTMYDDPNPNNLLSDAEVFSELRTHFFGLLSHMIATGLDAMHEDAKAVQFNSIEPEDPYEVFMGLLLQHCIPNIKPNLQIPVKNYFRLIQRFLRPQMPPVLPPARTPHDPANFTPQPPGLQGGWQ